MEFKDRGGQERVNRVTVAKGWDLTRCAIALMIFGLIVLAVADTRLTNLRRIQDVPLEAAVEGSRARSVLIYRVFAEALRIEGQSATTVEAGRIFYQKAIQPVSGITQGVITRFLPRETGFQARLKDLNEAGVGGIEARRQAYISGDLPSIRLNIPTD